MITGSSSVPAASTATDATIQSFLRGSTTSSSSSSPILAMAATTATATATRVITVETTTSTTHHEAVATTAAAAAMESRFLKSHSSRNFTNEWDSLSPQNQVMSAVGLALMFLVCWCAMTCLCNCLRSCFCGGGGHYHRIGGGRSNEYYHHNSSNRSCMNCLWALCCFECCCRDNQDVECCTLCGPLFCVEWFCPQR